MFKNKLVAVMNKTVEPGVLMNALAHMCIGFGAGIGKEPLQLVDYVTKDDQTYPTISKMPFIVLKANSNKIRILRESAQQEGIQIALFTDTMTVGSWEEQLERTAETNEEELTYYGIVLFGPWDKVSQLTRKFSLLK